MIIQYFVYNFQKAVITYFSYSNIAFIIFHSMQGSCINLLIRTIQHVKIEIRHSSPTLLRILFLTTNFSFIIIRCLLLSLNKVNFNIFQSQFILLAMQIFCHPFLILPTYTVPQLQSSDVKLYFVDPKGEDKYDHYRKDYIK